jgi:raffinose/stachyose/melibiose transport system substrate-binding protein
MVVRSTRRLAAAVAAGAALCLALTACGGSSSGSGDASGESVTLSFLVDNGPATVAQAEKLGEAFTKANPNITVEVDTRPPGGEGDNLIKTRLATGEMNDLFFYNSGSLFEALNPDQTLVNVADQDFVAKFDEQFKGVVSTDNGTYGVPMGTSLAGAVLYNKDIYQQLGLQIPKSWDEFMANSQKIKDSGLAAPIIQTYAATWSSQLFVLGDFFNVTAQQPDWAEKYTANQAKFVDEPAFAGFANQEEAAKAGLFNEDFASATYEDGLKMLAEGTGAQYPMLTFAAGALALNHADAVDKIGLFPLPGPDASSNGLTVWEPSAVYIPTSTEGAQLDAAKKFMAFLTTPEGCNIVAEETAPSGPFVVDGCELPADVPALVTDMEPYFENKQTGLALEFLSPVKGPALEQITVAVGSGITTAADGAAQYDEDVKKQAQQLGLPGW